MTQLENKRGSNYRLGQVGFARGINSFILLNPSLRGTVPQSLMATTVEAILGAVYLDSQRDIAPALRLVTCLGLTDDA